MVPEDPRPSQLATPCRALLSRAATDGWRDAAVGAVGAEVFAAQRAAKRPIGSC